LGNWIGKFKLLRKNVEIKKKDWLSIEKIIKYVFYVIKKLFFNLFH
jgi:hypothetical protein